MRRRFSINQYCCLNKTKQFYYSLLHNICQIFNIVKYSKFLKDHFFHVQFYKFYSLFSVQKQPAILQKYVIFFGSDLFREIFKDINFYRRLGCNKKTVFFYFIGEAKMVQSDHFQGEASKQHKNNKRIKFSGRAFSKFCKNTFSTRSYP